MAEKVIVKANIAGKPVPMKLFATWEVERTSPNCIPRLCSLRLTRLVVQKALESDLNSIIIAVRMQSSKRTLRSNEIFLQQGKLLDTVLDLSFSLQYPHFLKRDGNKLRIMLQRRKRYKNRTILGYKTLAVGLVNMSEVLQQSKDSELSLYGKEHGMARDKVAQVTVLGLSSQPVDQVKRDRSVDMESDDDDDSYSSDQENSDSGENMVVGQVRSQLHADQLPWNDLLGEGEDEHEHGRKGNKLHNATRQRNFKQKFIALLRKFKVASDESDTEPYPYEDQDQTPIDEDLFDELSLNNYSDSGPDMDLDEMSIESTPKPVLRPFFSQGIPTSSSMAENMEHVGQPEPSPDNSQETVKLLQDLYTKEESTEDVPPPETEDDNYSSGGDHHRRQGSNGSAQSTDANRNPVPAANGDRSAPASPAPSPGIGVVVREVPYKRSSSAGRDVKGSNKAELQEPQRRNRSVERSNSVGTADNKKPKLPIAEQLSELWLSDQTTPEKILLVNISEKQGQFIAQCLHGTRISLVTTYSAADVETTLQFIVHKIQKYCNQNAKVLSPIKIGVCGSDSYIGTVLKPYVEQFSTKSSDWLNYVKFYVIPFGSNSVAKYISSLDTRYNSLFQDTLWREMWEKNDKEDAADKREIANRVEKYFSGAATSLGLPIGEVMLTCKLRGSTNESCQKFVPFINNVLIGPPSSALGAVAIAEGEEPAPTVLSSSPPSIAKEKVDGITPPPSPAVSTTAVHQSTSSGSVAQTSPPASGPASDLLDLQVEYWPMSGSKKDKCSLKTAFRSLTVTRLPAPSDAPAASAPLSMMVVTKEKNKKMMRIGKKTPVPELKSQTMEGIYRLVCTSRTQDYSLTVTIDGNELTRVKFFQLSAQWQTHVKQFPVALFGHVEAPC